MNDTKEVNENTGKEILVVWTSEYKFRGRIFLGTQEIGFLVGSSHMQAGGAYQSWYPYLGEFDGKSCPVGSALSGDIEYLSLKILLSWLSQNRKIRISEIQESEMGNGNLAGKVANPTEEPKRDKTKKQAPKPIGA